MANKSRTLLVKNNPSTEPFIEVCPHQHFKSDIIDRSILSRKQHLNLLCTPKGYRWMIKETDRSAEKSHNEAANPCKLSKKKPGKTYVHNILAEIWDMITPEMAQRLKEMLMEEFGLSEEEALDFMCHTRYDTTLTANPRDRANKYDDAAHPDDRPPEGSTIGYLAAARNLCKNDFNIGISPCHVREFSKAVSSKVTDYVAAMLCAKRDAKHRTMAETILKGLCDLTGEQTTLDDPKNRLHKILTFTSDRLALLMVGNMEDEDKRRRNRRKREDRAMKKKRLAKEREQRRRQKERDKMYKEMKEHEKRKAEEEAEQKKLEDQEKERKKAEKEKRHQELEKFREEEKQRQKDEMKKAKAESGDNTKGGQKSRDRPKPPAQSNKAKTQESKGDGSKAAESKRLGPNNRTTNDQPKRTDGISGSKAQATSAGNAKQTESQVDLKESGGGQETTPKADGQDLQPEKSNASQLSTPKSVVWGAADDRIKSVASAFSSSGKLTPASSQSSSIDKLVEILSSQGRSASKLPKSKSEGAAAAASQEDSHPNTHSSQGIIANVTSSQGKLVPEHSSHHVKFGAASASEGKLGEMGTHRERDSILKVKKTVYDSYDVNRTSYAEAKQKIGLLKRKSSPQISPPTVPFDPNDPKSWENWVEYATQLAEDWGRWIDKTIQDTEDKAILYQAKAREGKTDPQDDEDWNRFVEKTNEDARRWRRQRKALLDAANGWKK